MRKIKTVQSIFPSKIASFFNYGTINILTEGDSAMIGTMSMYYVTNPDKAVSLIQSLVDEVKNTPIETIVVSGSAEKMIHELKSLKKENYEVRDIHLILEKRYEMYWDKCSKLSIFR